MRLHELILLGTLMLWMLIPLVYLLCLCWQTDFKLFARSKNKTGGDNR
jgi:hypothetical protein